MAVEIDGITFSFLAFSLGVALMFLITYRRFSKLSKKRVDELWSKANSLEGEAVMLKTEMEELQGSLSDKVDFDYLDKRISGLINLMKKSSS